MKRRYWTINGLLPILALGIAWIAQYGFGLLPCHLCLLQRYPYEIIFFIIINASLLKVTDKIKSYLLFFISMIFIFNSILALYHYGIEQQWWIGPASCTNDSSQIANSLEELQKLLTEKSHLIRCDQAAWSFHFISMSFLNSVYALGCAVFSFFSAKFYRMSSHV